MGFLKEEGSWKAKRISLAPSEQPTSMNPGQDGNKAVNHGHELMLILCDLHYGIQQSSISVS